VAWLPLKLLAVGLLIFGSAAAAMRTTTAGEHVAQLVPHPPKAQGEHCVAPTEFMRRYHMTMLMHHRTNVVHNGIRTQQYDLNRCIACHQVRGADGNPVSYASPKHFCRSCHDYAAVSIDCFECHASRPTTPSKTGALSMPPKLAEREMDEQNMAALTKYLNEVTP
jgi:hypothetical protein